MSVYLEKNKVYDEILPLKRKLALLNFYRIILQLNPDHKTALILFIKLEVINIFRFSVFLLSAFFVKIKRTEKTFFIIHFRLNG